MSIVSSPGLSRTDLTPECHISHSTGLQFIIDLTRFTKGKAWDHHCWRSASGVSGCRGAVFAEPPATLLVDANHRASVGAVEFGGSDGGKLDHCENLGKGEGKR